MNIKISQLEGSEAEYKKQVHKLTQLNLQADQRFYALEKSKQELILMRDNDYEAMKSKYHKLNNELKTFEKYYQNKEKE